MPKEIRNIGASERARLQNLSRNTGQSFELILTRYALERLLYRLSTSAYAERFVLNRLPSTMTDWPAQSPPHSRDVELRSRRTSRTHSPLLSRQMNRSKVSGAPFWKTWRSTPAAWLM
jgi:hypothetical protein